MGPAVRDVALLDSADGLRVLLHALIDGPYELAPSIAQVFIYLVDRPHLRAYLHSGLDLEVRFRNTLSFAPDELTQLPLQDCFLGLDYGLRKGSGARGTCSFQRACHCALS